MDINNPFYLEILRTLNENDVKYILVGGLAVGYYGYARYTGDMDLWVQPTKDNMDRLYYCLSALGYPNETITYIKENRDLENPTPIRLKDDEEILKVDLMTNTFQKLFTWEECYSMRKMFKIEDIEIPVIHINQLISIKENTNRLDNSLKDLVDANELKKIRDLGKSD